jgi:hypothetical protein
MGFPAIGARGLPLNRFEANRDGITAMLIFAVVPYFILLDDPVFVNLPNFGVGKNF